MGDKEFNNEQYVKAKSYYQEALRLNKDDATAKNKLNKTLQKIREQSEKEVIFYQYIDERKGMVHQDSFRTRISARKATDSQRIGLRHRYMCA